MFLKSCVSLLMVFGCLMNLYAPAAVLLTDSSSVGGEAVKASANTVANTVTEAVLPAVSQEYAVVASEKIGLKVAARRDASNFEDEIAHKIRAKYIPIELTLTNTSDKMLNIPVGGFYFLTKPNLPGKPLPTASDVYRSVKRRGVLRACLWGIPLGAVSFGILLGPTIIASGVHTKMTNESMRGELNKTVYRGGHLLPGASVRGFVFVRKGLAPTAIVLKRVINLEDETEAEFQAPILSVQAG